MLTSCNSSNESSLSDQKMYPVQYSVSLNKEVLSFTRSIPPFDIPEPTAVYSETGNDDVSDLCSYIEYIVYKNENQLPIRHRQFITTEPDFGIIYDSLPAGNYQIIFIAHSENSATLSDKKIVFDNISDTFHAKIEQEVGLSENTFLDVTLYRIIGKIEFVATDTIPEKLKKFTINVNRYPKQLDVFTGYGSYTNAEHLISYSLNTEDIGKSNFTHSFLSLIPTNSETLDIKLTATDKNELTIRSRTISDVKPLPNQTIRYSGRLYNSAASDDTFILSLHNGGSWGETVEETLPD